MLSYVIYVSSGYPVMRNGLIENEPNDY